MPIPDDERFERYLREFKPVAADPLLLERRKPLIWRSWVFAFSATALIALVALLFMARLRRQPAGAPSARRTAQPAALHELANSQPLTLQRANDLLTHASSFKAALDGVAFHRQRTNLPQGSESALANLSKEDIKL